ncbi:MAG: DUF3035 domain-containing protein [Rhodospirillaceae bacterium]|nr:DUF3035 domain-containing protein [Rhodospirillaceae bacterium]
MRISAIKSTAIICLIIAMGAVSGCADTRRALIKEKGAPDEFEVYTRAPLSLPPDFGLRPPAESGTVVRSSDDPTTQARIAVTGKQPQPQQQQASASSPGMAAIYARSGANSADPNIRQLVNRESSAFSAEDTSVMEGLMFSDEELNRGTLVDPAMEAARIRENKAKGIPLNEGEIPKIERKKPRLLEGIFN